MLSDEIIESINTILYEYSDLPICETLECAKDFIEQYKELHNAVLQYGRNCKYGVCSECPLRYYC